MNDHGVQLDADSSHQRWKWQMVKTINNLKAKWSGWSLLLFTQSADRCRPRRVSEQILNGTSAQVGYTLALVMSTDMLRRLTNCRLLLLLLLHYSAIHVSIHWKIRTEYKSKTVITKTKHNPEKANNTKHSKTKLAWFTRLLRHSARKWGGLILHVLPSPHGSVGLRRVLAGHRKNLTVSSQ